MKIRITNTTHLNSPPTGFFLDFGGKFLRGNQSLIMDDDALPDCVQDWTKQGLVRIENADSGEHISGPGEAVVTAGTRVNEVADSQYDDLDDVGFNPEDAREAALPNGAHMPPTAQMNGAKVTLGTETENYNGMGSSPLPGETARSVDDSDNFTIKAPRAPGVGSIIR